MSQQIQEKVMTYEELVDHFSKVNLKDFEENGDLQIKAGFAVDPGAIVQKICKAYKIVKPALNILLVLPIPGKVAIKGFMQLLDSLCP